MTSPSMFFNAPSLTESAPALPTFETDPAADTPTLPRQRTQSVENLTDHPLDGQATQTHALVADPDTHSRDAMASTLREHGVSNVDQAGPAAEVTQALVDQPGGDLLLLSLSYGAHSAEIVATAREHGWSRVVALSPTADIGPVIDAVGAGVVGGEHGADVAVAVEHLAQIGGAGEDVIAGLEGIGAKAVAGAQPRPGAGHDLHQADGANG